MNRADQKPSFRLWEYVWFAVMTAVLLAAGLVAGLFGMLSRLAGLLRK
ncbi:MAG: hypothetical protein GY867_04145 [bacterium]|nr:hypothetical protein [bacterium]